MVGQRAQLSFDAVGHTVEILAHGSRVHMVQDGACGTGSAINYAGEGVVLHHIIYLPLAGGNLHLDGVPLHLVGNVLGLGEVVYRIRHQQHLKQLRHTPGIGDGNLWIQLLIDMEKGFVVHCPAHSLVAVGQDH